MEKMNKKEEGTNLRRKITKRLRETEIPILVYAVVFLTMFMLWRYQSYDDLAMDFFVELGGAAFTLFIIDVLLVRSKTKRWKVVRDDMNYLIARNVNRIRDGVASRVFAFEADIPGELSPTDYALEVRKQRTAFLHDISDDTPEDILPRLKEEVLFSDGGYEYFNEKASEIWDVLNIKYSDYFHPNLVSSLILLNVNLRDLCSHIRQYQKARRFPSSGEAFKAIGRQGAAVSLLKIIDGLNYLKKEGYSETAALTLDPDDRAAPRLKT